MKNKEKFSKEIFDIACKGYSIAVTIANNEIVPCESIECGKCIFKVKEYEECSGKIKKWCESEYVDKPKLTITSKEKKFLDLLLPKYNYIARDYNTGKLSLYKYKPFKNSLTITFLKPTEARSDNLTEENEKLMQIISHNLEKRK